MFRGQLFAARLYQGRLWAQNGQDSVIAGVAPVILTTSPLASALAGTAYAQTLAASGTAPITWAVTAGSLPDGLSLSIATGLISGTPTFSGVYSFTVSATNEVATVAASFQLLVSTAEPEIPPDIPDGSGTMDSGVYVGGTFKVALLQAVHNFSSVGGDVFKIALYDENADFTSVPAAYTTAHEVTGTGYSAGGVTLVNTGPTLVDGVAVATFTDATFSAVTISPRYALLYNSSKANSTVAVIDFKRTFSVTSTDFRIAMPPATATNAFIRVM